MEIEFRISITYPTKFVVQLDFSILQVHFIVSGLFASLLELIDLLHLIPSTLNLN